MEPLGADERAVMLRLLRKYAFQKYQDNGPDVCRGCGGFGNHYGPCEVDRALFMLQFGHLPEGWEWV